MNSSGPSSEDRDREAQIALARTALKFGQTIYVRKKAMREIEELTAKRSPAMLAWLEKHPEAA